MLENGIHLKVQGIEQNRIVKVLMTLPEEEEKEEEEDEAPDDSSGQEKPS